MTIKEELHRLVDELPESESHAARRFLEYLRNMGDPVLRAMLEAPEDDEPETEEERAAVAEAQEDFKAGRVVSHQELKREFGL
jgi:CO dehydrogenase/acetyl-CoA synthase beta subunit